MATLNEIMESHTNRRRLSLVGMAVVAGGFLAACGDEEEEEDVVEEVEEGGEDALGTVEGEAEDATEEESQ